MNILLFILKLSLLIIILKMTDIVEEHKKFMGFMKTVPSHEYFSGKFNGDISRIRREIMRFEKSNNIILPFSKGKQLFEMENFVIRLTHNGKWSYGKAVNYDVDENTIVVPKRMLDMIELNFFENVHVRYEILKNIAKIDFKVPKQITNPLDILEFELQFRSVLSKNDIIIVKLFDTMFEIFVEKLEDKHGNNIKAGFIFNNELSSDIKFDFSFIET